MGREGEQLLALTGPCSCSSCGGVLLVPPAGQEQAEPQREDMSQVHLALNPCEDPLETRSRKQFSVS